MRNMLKATYKGLPLRDDMAFPRREDYLKQLLQHGLIKSEADR